MAAAHSRAWRRRGLTDGHTCSLVAWAALNSWALTRPFDPFPCIFLNLMLSMLAAIQAPIIMMSQNRQAATDRRQARRDFEIDLKAELEILALHAKLDQLLATTGAPDVRRKAR